MTVSEAIRRSGSSPAMLKASIDEAQKLLDPGEDILWAQTARVTADVDGKQQKNAGVVVLTPRRLLFVNRILGTGVTKQLPLPEIVDITKETGTLFATVQITGTEETLLIEDAPQTITGLKAALDNAGKANTAQPAPAAPAQNGIDLEPYFQKYYPSRMRAVKALHRDTGLALPQCKELIGSYFQANLARVPMPKNEDPVRELKRRINPEKLAREERMAALDQQGISYCPKCASTSISAGKRGFSVGRGLAGSLIHPIVGLTAGAIGSNKTECVCLKCGNTWIP